VPEPKQLCGFALEIRPLPSWVNGQLNLQHPERIKFHPPIPGVVAGLGVVEARLLFKSLPVFRIIASGGKPDRTRPIQVSFQQFTPSIFEMANFFTDLYFPTLFESMGSYKGDAEQARAGSGSELVDPESDEGSPPSSFAGTRDKRKRLELRRVTSKRYRDTLGVLYSDLETLVPSVFPTARPRTKSQIIQVTGEAIRKLKQEVSGLEAQYILSCPANRLNWIERVVHSAPTFRDVSYLFMRLMIHGGWSYAEMWSSSDSMCRIDTDDLIQIGQNSQASKVKGSGRMMQGQDELKMISSTYDDRILAMPSALASLTTASRQHTAQVGDASLVGIVTSTLCPKCLVLGESTSSSPSQLMQYVLQAGLKVCFALPLLVRGEIVTVVLLFAEEYNDATKSLHSVSEEMGAAIGNCYGAARKEAVERPVWSMPSGSSANGVPSSSISGDTAELSLSPDGVVMAVTQPGMQAVPLVQQNRLT
jgi:hypothetical protein